MRITTLWPEQEKMFGDYYIAREHMLNELALAQSNVKTLERLLGRVTPSEKEGLSKRVIRAAEMLVQAKQKKPRQLTQGKA